MVHPAAPLDGGLSLAMQSTLDLPWPRGWKRPALNGWGLPIFLGCGAVLTGSLAIGGIAIGAVTSGPASLLVAAGCLGVLTIVLVATAVGQRPRVNPVTVEWAEIGVDGRLAGGVRIPVKPTRKVTVVALVFFGGLFLLLAVAALGAGVAKGELLKGIVAGLVVGGVGAVFLLGGVAGLRSRSDGLGIDLTREHLAIALGMERVVLRWSEIEDVKGIGHRVPSRSGPRPVQNSDPGLREGSERAAQAEPGAAEPARGQRRGGGGALEAGN